MKKILLSLAIVIFSFAECLAQVHVDQKNDTLQRTFCDAPNQKALRGPSNTSLLQNMVNPLPPNTFMICANGKFRLIFMDVLSMTGQGFDDPILGSIRQNCVCNVINYLESVISIPSIIGTNPSTPTIDIVFNISTNIPNSSTLASAAPVFPAPFYNTVPNPAPGYYGGFLYDYITTGIKPVLTS